MPSFNVCTDEREYDVSLASWVSPTRSSWHSPGDGGEVELEPFVEVFYLQSAGGGNFTDVVTLETCILDYAVYSGRTVEYVRSYFESLAMNVIFDMSIEVAA